ncbi:MAG: oxygen-independent coproporphyrinogen III oxidase-like protein [Rhodocyclaceae bacterium]|jgi:oxygen-independent coproporphyrinogen-3 oxidase|nr:oxygen-independent coproporphyrinogen III oxidase-like protein [Rhodocyclaceae bacterium]
MTRHSIPVLAVPPAPTLNPPPLSLYVHWPWCVRKCPYCDFNSHESSPQEAAYLDALIADLEAALPLIWGRPVVSVFIGGGTPSLMAGETVEALLSAIRARVRLLPGAEITLEANPGTVEAARFAAYRDAGVNRLSLGIQSFDDAKLAALGRIHSGLEARRAIETAQRHFERVNLDLMVALPEQSLADARRDIDTAIASGVSHISAYHLTLEPNTPFHHAPPPLPDEDLAADMLEMVEAELVSAGFEHYETSAYAKPGEACRHNLNYWTFGDYLGIGAGAHSKLSDHAGIQREARPRHPKDYLADPITRRWQPVAPEDLPGEFMMNALRLTQGVPLALFTERTGLPLEAIEKSALPVLRNPEAWPPTFVKANVSNANVMPEQKSALAGRHQGLLEIVDDRLKPTPLGRRFLNRLIMLFLSA